MDTLDQAQALAEKTARVAEQMAPAAQAQTQSNALTVVIPEPVRPEDVSLDHLVDAVDRVNRFLPEAVDLMIEDFKGRKNEDGERIPPKPATRRLIFETLAKFSLTDRRLEQAFGLMKEQAGQDGGVAIGQLLNINILDLRKDHKQIDQMLQDQSNMNDTIGNCVTTEVSDGG